MSLKTRKIILRKCGISINGNDEAIKKKEHAIIDCLIKHIKSPENNQQYIRNWTTNDREIMINIKNQKSHMKKYYNILVTLLVCQLNLGHFVPDPNQNSTEVGNTVKCLLQCHLCKQTYKISTSLVNVIDHYKSDRWAYHPSAYHMIQYALYLL